MSLLPALNAAPDLQPLTDGLRHPKFWTSVHAAEYLLDLDLAPAAVDAFVARKRQCEAVPVERIGLWRVMALRAQGTPEYARLLDRIRRIAFAVPPTADQTHAVETLLKLQYKCTPSEAARLRRILRASDSAVGLQIYSAALLALADPTALSDLERLLERHRQDPLWCGVLLYALRLVPNLSERLYVQAQAFCRTSPSEENRMAAALLLLNHRRLTYAQLPRPPREPGKDALAVLLLYAPQSPEFRRMLGQMRRSDNAEWRLFAAYAALQAGAH